MNGSFGSILLKNAFSIDDEKILTIVGSEARIRLGGIHERVDVAMWGHLIGLPD